MAGTGPMPKKGAQRSGGKAKASPATVPAGAPVAASTAPTPPVRLTDDELALWTWAWGTEVAKNWHDSDALTVAAYVRAVAERERLGALVRTEGEVVMGSRGQPSGHPLLGRLGTLDAEVRQLADRLGLNTAARLKLGLTQSTTALTVAHLQAALAGD